MNKRTRYLFHGVSRFTAASSAVAKRAEAVWDRVVSASTLSPLMCFPRLALLVVMSRRWHSNAARNDSWLPDWFWLTALVAYCVYVIASTIFSLRLARHGWSPATEAVAKLGTKAQILIDCIFAAVFLVLGGDPESDLAFAFLMPLVLCAVSLPGALIVLTLALVLLLFCMITGLQYRFLSGLHPRHVFAQVLFVKSAIFVSTSLLIARVIELRRRMYERMRASETLLHFSLTEGRDLAWLKDLDEIIEAATRAAAAQVRAEAVQLFIFEDGRYRRKKSVGLPDHWFADESYAPGEGMTGGVGLAPEGERFGVPELNNFAGEHPLNLDRYERSLASRCVAHFLAVPLNGPNRTFGVLRAINKRTESGEIDPTGFTPDDKSMFMTVAAQIALAYSKARQEAKDRAITALHDRLAHIRDEREICETITATVVDDTMLYRASSVLIQESSNRLRPAAQSGLSANGTESSISLSMLVSARRQVLATGQCWASNLRTYGDAATKAWAERNAVESVLILPLSQQDNALGVLEAYTSGAHEFFQDERETLQRLAMRGSIAIVNARVAAQNERVDRLTALATEINAYTDRNKMLMYVANEVAAIFRAEDCAIFWLNRQGDALEMEASCTVPPEHYPRLAIPIASRMSADTSECPSEPDDIYRRSSDAINQVIERLALLPSRTIRSLSTCPVVSKSGEMQGLLQVVNVRDNAARGGDTASDSNSFLLRILGSALGNQMALLEQMEKQHRLYEAAHEINQAGEPRDVLRRIAEFACAVVPADVAAIFPFNGDGQLLIRDGATFGHHPGTERFHTTHPRGTGVTRQALYQSDDGVSVVPDYDLEPTRRNAFIKENGIRACLAIVLHIESAPVGILFCDLRRPHHFSKDEIETAKAFGALAAHAMANARERDRLQRQYEGLSTDLLNVYHDITGTPLQTVSNGIELLLNPLYDPCNPRSSKQLVALQLMRNDLSDIQEQFTWLRTARQIADERIVPEMSVIWLHHVVNEAVERIRTRANDSGIEVRYEARCPPDVVLEGDSRRLRLALVHLLENAIKYMASRGSITIHVHPTESEVAISVADTGYGIPPEDQACMFEEWTRGTSLYTATTSGKGLGLHIVRLIVERDHGGSITVNSELGMGSTFIVRLPRIVNA